MVALGSLDHPNIVRAIDAGEDRGTHYLVMEYVDGVDLGRVCQLGKQLPIDQAAEVIRQAALGIEYVHDQGRIHRDIKPSNLMLSNAGQVKVLDLGLARVEELPAEDPAEASDNILGAVSQDLTQTHQVMGTLAYMAPEQAVDSRSVDHLADIYALGGTLYKLLTGSAPFGNSTSITAYSQVLAHLQKPVVPVRDIRPDVPAELSDLADQMLAKDPDDRPQSAGEIARRILPWSNAADLQPLVEIGRGVAAATSDTLVDASTQRQRPQAQHASPVSDANQKAHGNSLLPVLATVTMIMVTGGLAWWNRFAPQYGTIIVRAVSDDIESSMLASGPQLESDDGRIALTAEPMQIPIGKYEVVAGNNPDLRFSPSQFELLVDQQIILQVDHVPRLVKGDGPFNGDSPTPPTPPESISLVSLVDPQRDIRSDDWVLNDGALECRSDRIAYMKFPYRPPADYRVDMLVERVEADDCLVLGITGGENGYLICFDAHPAAGWVSGLTKISGQSLPNRRAYTHRGQLLKQGEPTLISAEVHHQGQRISIQVNAQGKTIFQWRGSKQSLMPVSPTGSYPHNDPSTLFLSNWHSKFLVSDLRVTSLEGTGQAIEFTDPGAEPVRAAAELAVWKGGKVKLLDESEQAIRDGASHNRLADSN